MLPEFHRFRRVYVEITKSAHNHGGKGWEFGTCLWSPTTNSAGDDRYSLMRDPRAGDLVLHFLERSWPDGTTESRFSGTSRVKEAVQTVATPPPEPGPWGQRDQYFRIDLEAYTPLNQPLPLRTLLDSYGGEIRKEILEAGPRFYPFSRFAEGLRTVQGIYLARCTEQLYLVLEQALGIEKAEIASHEGRTSLHQEYAEAKRLASERYFFARNPTLRRDAILKYKAKCEVCAFDFEEKYGDRGKGYIEVHHRDPLSERSEKEWNSELCSRLEDVAVLCANCHRMIHRTRPAISVEELKILLRLRSEAEKGSDEPRAVDKEAGR